MRTRLLILIIFSIGAGSLTAQTPPSISLEPLSCLPVEDNGVLRAVVSSDRGGYSARLYFRRVNIEVEDFYWLSMFPENGRYWTVFPKPSNHQLTRKEMEQVRDEVAHRWASWWREKEESESRDPNDDLDTDLIEERASLGKLANRDWMATLDDRALQDWLEDLEYEPVEYYAVIRDTYGNELAKSPMAITRVNVDCDVELSAQEAGLAENLTIGETAGWQRSEQPFHWLCDGVVTRIDPSEIHRADELCRACVIAWWKKKSLLLPASSGSGISGVLIDDKEKPPVSPSRP